MTKTRDRDPAPETVVQLRGGIADDLVGYARTKVDAVLAHTGPKVLHARVRVIRHGDPARERPVTAQANVDLDGRPVRVQTEATTPREAVDRLVAQLGHRLERVGLDWESRRGRAHHGEPHEWRHDSPPARRRDFFPRPPEERQVVRHKSVSPVRCGIDEAVAEMDDLDYDFHLFVEDSRGVDSVVYRAGTTGIRLAQLDGKAADVPAGSVEFTTSTQPAPLLDVEEAAQRLQMTALPFLFYLDAEHGRGCVLYNRYDGHYGLIDPQAEAGPATSR